MKVVEKVPHCLSWMLFGAPHFGHVLELLDWISTTVKEVEEYHNMPHYPVLVVHMVLHLTIEFFLQNCTGEKYQ